MKKPSLPVQIIIGLVLGILWALLSSSMGWSDFTIDWIAPFGTIFINLLKLIAIPLVLFSIIAGIGNLSDTATLGRMGVKTLALYIGSTVLAAAMGMFIANTFNPGKQASEEQLKINRLAYELWVNESEGVEYFDDIRLLNDPTMATYLTDAQSALAEQQSNEELNAKMSVLKNKKETGPLQFFVDMVPSNIFLSFNDSLMLQVIFFAIFFGIVMVMLPNAQMQPVAAIINGFSDIFIKMVDVVMKGAPFFVFALLAGKLAEMAGDEPGRLVEIFKALGAYTGYTILGLLIMILLLYPAVIAFLVHRKTNMGYWKSWGYFMRGIRPAQLLAFSTSSTAATLPVTMDCVRDNLGVDEEIGSFVLPVGRYHQHGRNRLVSDCGCNFHGPIPHDRSQPRATSYDHSNGDIRLHWRCFCTFCRNDHAHPHSRECGSKPSVDRNHFPGRSHYRYGAYGIESHGRCFCKHHHCVVGR